MSTSDLFVFAGEASGDLYGKELVRSLKKENKTLRIFGVAGPLMRQEGVETLLEMEEFQVIGFFDVLICLPKLIKKFYFLRREILKRNPSIALFIDYPGFCLRQERSLRKKGYQGTIVHAIAPTVWAWGKKRISLIEKNVDILLTLFPFEKELFPTSSLQVEYVGHPLEKKIPPQGRKKTGQKKFIGIFPGSRKKEILRNIPFQLDAIRHLFQKDPVSFLLHFTRTSGMLPSHFFTRSRSQKRAERASAFSLFGREGTDDGENPFCNRQVGNDHARARTS